MAAALSHWLPEAGGPPMSQCPVPGVTDCAGSTGWREADTDPESTVLAVVVGGYELAAVFGVCQRHNALGLHRAITRDGEVAVGYPLVADRVQVVGQSVVLAPLPVALPKLYWSGEGWLHELTGTPVADGTRVTILSTEVEAADPVPVAETEWSP